MTKPKERCLFLQEIKQLEKLRNALHYSTKLNGTQVLLSNENRDYLQEAVYSIQQSINSLNKIKKLIP